MTAVPVEVVKHPCQTLLDTILSERLPLFVRQFREYCGRELLFTCKDASLLHQKRNVGVKVPIELEFDGKQFILLFESCRDISDRKANWYSKVSLVTGGNKIFITSFIGSVRGGSEWEGDPFLKNLLPRLIIAAHPELLRRLVETHKGVLVKFNRIQHKTSSVSVPQISLSDFIFDQERREIFASGEHTKFAQTRLAISGPFGSLEFFIPFPGIKIKDAEIFMIPMSSRSSMTSSLNLCHGPIDEQIAIFKILEEATSETRALTETPLSVVLSDSQASLQLRPSN